MINFDKPINRIKLVFLLPRIVNNMVNKCEQSVSLIEIQQFVLDLRLPLLQMCIRYEAYPTYPHPHDPHCCSFC